jgi:hypothetical protein
MPQIGMKSSKSTLALASALLLGAAGLGVWWNLRTPTSVISSNPKSPIPKPQSYSPNHPIVARIVKDGPTMPYLKFNYLIKEIPTDLAAHDLDALIAFISAPQPTAFQDAEWGSLVNDIEEILTVQTIPNEKVARALSAIYRDEKRIQLQRDYALQHIGGFAMYLVHTSANNQISTVPNRQLSIPSSTQSPISNFQSLLLADLRHATSDPTKPWAGTALNLLDGILRAADSRAVQVPGLTSESLSALAQPIAENPALPLNSRLPALQLIGRHRAPQAAPLARRLLADPDSSLMLIQASAAILAQCGGNVDLPLLQKQLTAATPHTRPALDHAIKSLTTSSPVPEN